jgi:hypothetical protein
MISGSLSGSLDAYFRRKRAVFEATMVAFAVILAAPAKVILQMCREFERGS